jgi:riboflavin synthase
MFTGLVQDIGKIASVRRAGGAIRWAIQSPQCAARLKIGDSVNVAGVCQTVESVAGDTISGTAIAETLRKTTFGRWEIGHLVNLELALRADDRLGGHIVSGHVDTVGTILRRRETSSGTYLSVTFAGQFDNWSVEQGSVALDGVSLTIAGRIRGMITVALIPETLRRTTLGAVRTGDPVNVEFDQLVKAAVQQTTGAVRGASRVDTALLAKSGW